MNGLRTSIVNGYTVLDLHETLSRSGKTAYHATVHRFTCPAEVSAHLKGTNGLYLRGRGDDIVCVFDDVVGHTKIVEPGLRLIAA